MDGFEVEDGGLYQKSVSLLPPFCSVHLLFYHRFPLFPARFLLWLSFDDNDGPASASDQGPIW